MKGVNREAAAQYVGNLSDAALRVADAWNLRQLFVVKHHELDDLVRGEQLRRGLIDMSVLSPPQRRRLATSLGVGLKALADGPIMDAAHLYLPAGKLSMADTIARERAGILPVSNGRLTDSSAKPSVLSGGAAADGDGSVAVGNGRDALGGGCDG